MLQKLPNERPIETDSPKDLERPCAREPRPEQTVPSSAAPASRTKRDKQAVKDAKEIMLDYGDYFTILLTGISGIFVNSLPLSS